MTIGFSGNTFTGSNEPTPVERAHAEGYKAGRSAALREVGCMAVRPITPDRDCHRCRLLAEAESGEQVREVGDDR